MTKPQKVASTPTIGDLIDEAIFKKQQGDEFVIRFKGQMLSGFGGDMDIVRDKTEGVANVKGNMAKQILGGLMMKAFEMGEAASSAERHRLREALKAVQPAITQAMDCIRGETPEDCSPGEAEDSTFNKLRDADTTIGEALQSSQSALTRAKAGKP